MLIRICWILLFIIDALVSQAQGTSAKVDNCTITVWAINPTGKEIVVDIQPISLQTRPVNRTQYRMLLNEKNASSLTVAMKVPSIVKLMNLWKDSTASYVAMPGASLAIHQDAVRKDTVQHNDIGPKETAFYEEVYTASQERLASIAHQNAEVYLKKWEEAYHHVQELVAGASSRGISDNYISWISESMRSLFQAQLCRQLVSYVTISRRWPSNMDEYANSITPLTAAQLNDPSFFTRETDKEFVESYYLFHSLVQDNRKALPAPGAETAYRNAIGNALKLTSAISREVMLRYLVGTATTNATDSAFLKWMKNATASSRQHDYFSKLITDKLSLLKIAGKGKKAPFFEATDISGSAFSYAKYEGKYLFIDIWATWCVPCKKEIPYLEALIEKYKDQPVAFVSVSIDKNFGAWKKFVESTDSKGQFHSVQGKASGINDVYNANLIPAFVLIDPQGKIINPATFRPSNPALKLLLDELLKK
ncbi:MAG TPA: TlpA disulfide reductase family protein [Chitinophagaceae bacterium]